MLRKRVVVAVLIIATVAAGVWFQRSRSTAQPATETMRTARVARGTLTASVTASGTLRPYAQVEVRSRATGTVIDIRVQEGDNVTKGQLLAAIDDSDARAGYETALAQLAASQAKINQARQQLNATRAQDVARVAQAEDALRTAHARSALVMAGSRPEGIEQAKATLTQAQLAADLAQRNLERTRDLHSQGLVARQNIDQAQNQHEVALAQVRSAQARLNEVQAGSTPQDIAVVQAQVREAESALASARAARKQEGVLAAAVVAAEADSRSRQADVAQALERSGEMRVTAPIDGIVARLEVQVGQTVIGGVSSGGTLLMTLADTRVIQAEIAVDESDIAQIRTGIPVRITVDALPERTFNGRVTRIAPQATVTQNVTQFNVIVTVENPGQLLRLGMSADGEFIITERRDVLLVPGEAIRGKDAKIVQLVQGETLVPVVVETGATDGRQVEIVKGLQEGQMIYLGQANRTSGQTPAQQPVNPFQPQIRPGSGPGGGPGSGR